MSKVLKVLVLSSIMLFISSVAKADGCTSGTLASYDTAGFSCTIDGKTFSNFGYSATAGGGANPVLASSVNVIPCPSAAPQCVAIPAGEEGFIFTAPWGVTSGQSQDSLISYTVTSSTPIIDALLLYGGFGQTGTGFASVAETLSNGGSLFVSDPPGSPSSQTITFGPVSTLNVDKDIELDGGTSGTAAISKVANAWSQTPVVPEPGTLALLGTGLLSFGGLLRRRLKK